MNTPEGWVAFVGEAFSRHESWGAALDLVAGQLGIERAEIWFQDRPDVIWLFDGPPGHVVGPAALVLDPTQYQRAKSRGDLEDEGFPQLAGRFMLHINQTASNVPTTGQECHLLPGLTNAESPQTRSNTAPMIKLPSAEKAKAEKLASRKAELGTATYCVAQESFYWRAKSYRRGGLVPPPEKLNASELHKLELHLGKGWLRVATDEDRKAAAEAPVPKKSAAPKAAAATDTAAPGEFQNLDPHEIAPSPVNPRRHFADAAMQELTDSVREKVRVAINVRAMPAGVWFVEPGTRSGKPGWFLTDRRRFRPNPGTTGGQIYEHIPDELFQHFFPTQAEATAALPKWEIIAGERRWRAARYAGSETIRALVETMDDLEAAELQVIENDQREDLSPLESAAGYQYLLNQPGYNIKTLIQRTGKSKTTIYDRLKLLEMPAVLQDAVVAGVCPMSTAQKIGAAAPEIREAAAKRILGLENDRGQALKPRDGQKYEVQTFREAEETLEGLKGERDRQAEHDKIKAELVKEGFKVIAGGEATNVLYHDGTLVHGSGYVRAGDICPRDPKSRQWEKVLKGQDVTRYAAITGRWNGPAKGVRVYKLEDANRALKKLGLWDVEGSKASEEKIERQKKKEKVKAEMGAMHADLDRIVAAASVPETKQIRAVLTAVLQKMLPSWDDEMVRMIAERRKLPTTGFRKSAVSKAAEKMTLGEMLGLVAEVCTYGLGYRIDPANGGDYLRVGRSAVSELLGIKPAKGEKAASPDVRTEAETADEEEEMEVPA